MASDVDQYDSTADILPRPRKSTNVEGELDHAQVPRGRITTDVRLPLVRTMPAY